MIQKLSHGTVYVLDQDEAKTFYTQKLGFDVRQDVSMDGFRWLTVGPKGQPDFEIVLMPVGPSPMMDVETAATLRQLVAKGAFGCGVLETADCARTYEELKDQGVRFVCPPTQRPYGLEAVLLDDSGNWFSLVERPR